ncbi:hypothetical protein FH972_025431 [Carpinus fangiana]|uniref:Homeobox domain-containing protein n=1 Tax=Carpinus fangiana TaxID=176857 RepID=A0A5N6L110_9ROSI|nr:hypothetical protein FH972_025431 [Carpinus fangiana]KAB8527779.1 hypothetical protein FH972_025431 [Carpinus fangiana]
MLYQSSLSSPVNHFQTSVSSSNTHLHADSMSDDRKQPNLPSFNEQFRSLIPPSSDPHTRNHDHDASLAGPLPPSSSTIQSPQKRSREEYTSPYQDSRHQHHHPADGRSHDWPTRPTDHDEHRAKRRSEAGLTDDRRRESETYGSSTSNNSRASFASSASFPHPALPEASPTGPPSQPFSSTFRGQPSLPAASPSGPPMQPFSAFSRSQHARRQSFTWPQGQVSLPPSSVSAPQHVLPPPPGLQPSSPQYNVPMPTLQRGVGEAAPGAASNQYAQHRRASYHDEPTGSNLPRRPPVLDTQSVDALRPPRICTHCQQNPHAPRHVDCPHVHNPSPTHQASLQRPVLQGPPVGYGQHSSSASSYGPGPHAIHPTTENYSWQAGAGPGGPSEHNRRRRGNLPKESTNILNSWFNAHASYPYPKEDEKQALQQQCNLTMAQISNWFINARRRRNPNRINNGIASHP